MATRLLLLIPFFALSLSGRAWGGPLCVPMPAGIPGEAGPPEWWGVVTGQREDPRWCGALGVGHVEDRGRFQMLTANDAGTDHLYLSWEIRAAGGGGAADILYFGFVDPGFGVGTAFKITVPTDTGVGTIAKVPIASGQVQWRAKLASGVAWGAWSVSNAGTAPWMQDTGRYWVDCSGNCDTYTVMVRIPIDANAAPNDFDLGLNIANDTLFWYDIQVLQPGLPPTTAHHALPEGHAFSVANFGNPAYPSNSDWAVLQLSGAGCETGVAVDTNDVYVTHGPSSPDHVITIDNTLHTTPGNDSGGALDGDAVSSRIRMSNWGTAGPGDAPTWDEVPGCALAVGAGVVLDGADFDLTCDWMPSMATLCAYRPSGALGTLPPWDVCIGAGVLSPEQWLLVELSAGPGSTGDVLLPTASTCRAVSVLEAPAAVPGGSPGAHLLLISTLSLLAVAVLVSRRSHLDA